MSGTPGPAIQPLRIHKHSSSQDFDATPPTSPQPPRPLSELDIIAGRRNSVQYKVARRFGEDMAALGGSTRASPRAFWLGNLQENAKVKDSPAPSPRRTSLENLKKASRVQNNKLLKQHLHSPSPSPTPSRPMSMPPQSSGSPLKLESAPLKSSLTSPKKADPNSPPRAQTTPPKNATLTSIMRGDNSTPIRAPGRGKSSLLASYKVNGRSDIEEGTDGEDSTHTSPNRRKAVTFDEVPAQVVEYELITPVPSVDGSPSMSYDSHDSDDDDEYDYDNTPVIEPDHWRDMPERVATPPRLGDPFRASPSPTGRPLPPLPGTSLSRSDSTSSNRPLPSIPFKSQIQSQQQISLHEKMQMMMQKSNAELHPDPNAHVEEERAFGTTLGISFEEMPLNEGENEETDDGSRTMSPEPVQKETTLDNYEAGAGPYSKSMQFDKEFDFKRPKKISRDSIRRHVTRRDGSTSSVGSNESGETLSTVCDESEGGQSMVDEARTVDMSIVPGHDSARPISRYATRSPDAEIASAGSEYTGGDNDSRYSGTDDSDSDATPTAGTPRAISPAALIAAATTLSDPTENVPILSAPVPASPPTPPKEDEVPEKRLSLSLPEFTTESNTDGLGLRAFMTPSPPPITAPSAAAEPTPVPSPEPTPLLTATPILPPPISPRVQHLDRPSTPENQHIGIDEDLERTPESVIRHKIYHSDGDSEYDDDYYEEAEGGEEADETAQVESEADNFSRAEAPQIVEPRRSPSPIPEDAATIRAPGGKLRTRPSATPADMAAMAAQRRQVSGDHTHAARMLGSSDEEGSEEDEEDEDEDEDEDVDEEEEEDDGDGKEGTVSGPTDTKGKAPMRKASRKSLKMPTLDELNIDLNLDEEFDRVIETQKRGYLMRHSTRVIHASSRDIDEEPTARPQSHKRTQSWQVEPWKGSGRRRSTRNSLGQTGGQQDGAAPSGPGQAGPTPALHLAPPPTTAGAEGQKPPTPPENGERGRLFVKVIGVKDLTLPMPQREPTWFCLTLDNGLHCVTTSWLELAKNAPIGQEFELVVLNDLEFQLTLQTKLEKPPPKAVAAPPTPPPQPQKIPKPKSTFSRVFISPKKRKELERQQREQQQLLQQQQAQAQAQAQAQKTQPEEPLSAWELLNGLVARDGSFARSYVCLKDFEQKAYGRPFITEINCFNEWAIEPGSLKTKRGNNPVRRPPYRIGKLEVQMLFVPKPPGMTDKDLPKSMAAAIRELKEAENMVARSWEGYLSQQGGDCPFWRRRYFKLIGAKLTAYHEVSRQPRATINLAKAIRLIDDRPSLTEPEIPTTNGKRRKSAFAEMEEGYMFVEEGFRIKFQNGETIDFYAGNAEDKLGWMSVLGETIGGGQENRSWCELILNKEKLDREQATATQQRRVQQQQVQMQQFEKSYMPSTPGRNDPTGSRTDLGDGRPSPPPRSTKRPVSGIPAGYPQGSIGSLHSITSIGR